MREEELRVLVIYFRSCTSLLRRNAGFRGLNPVIESIDWKEDLFEVLCQNLGSIHLCIPIIAYEMRGSVDRGSR